MPRTVPPASPSYSFLLLKPTAPPTVYTLALHDALPIPAQPNVAIGFDLPMRPTEHILSANSTLRLEIRGVAAAEATDPFGVVGARTFIEAGADGTHLSIPTVPISEYKPIPLTVVP